MPSVGDKLPTGSIVSLTYVGDGKYNAYDEKGNRYTINSAGNAEFVGPDAPIPLFEDTNVVPANTLATTGADDAASLLAKEKEQVKKKFKAKLEANFPPCEAKSTGVEGQPPIQQCSTKNTRPANVTTTGIVEQTSCRCIPQKGVNPLEYYSKAVTTDNPLENQWSSEEQKLITISELDCAVSASENEISGTCFPATPLTSIPVTSFITEEGKYWFPDSGLSDKKTMVANNNTLFLLTNDKSLYSKPFPTRAAFDDITPSNVWTKMNGSFDDVAVTNDTLFVLKNGSISYCIIPCQGTFLPLEITSSATTSDNKPLVFTSIYAFGNVLVGVTQKDSQIYTAIVSNAENGVFTTQKMTPQREAYTSTLLKRETFGFLQPSFIKSDRFANDSLLFVLGNDGKIRAQKYPSWKAVRPPDGTSTIVSLAVTPNSLYSVGSNGKLYVRSVGTDFTESWTEVTNIQNAQEPVLVKNVLYNDNAKIVMVSGVVEKNPSKSWIAICEDPCTLGWIMIPNVWSPSSKDSFLTLDFNSLEPVQGFEMEFGVYSKRLRQPKTFAWSYSRDGNRFVDMDDYGNLPTQTGAPIRVRFYEASPPSTAVRFMPKDFIKNPVLLKNLIPLRGDGSVPTNDGSKKEGTDPSLGGVNTAGGTASGANPTQAEKDAKAKALKDAQDAKDKESEKSALTKWYDSASTGTKAGLWIGVAFAALLVLLVVIAIIIFIKRKMSNDGNEPFLNQSVTRYAEIPSSMINNPQPGQGPNEYDSVESPFR